MRLRAAASLAAVGPESLDNLGPNSQQGVQRGHRVLVDHRDAGTPNRFHPPFVELGEDLVLETDLAAEHLERSREEPEHRQHRERLARSALADHADLLAGQDVEVDAAHDLANLMITAGADPNVAQREHGHAPPRRSTRRPPTGRLRARRGGTVRSSPVAQEAAAAHRG